ncbi:telomeric repeat-binding factor 2-like [Vigna unguiculata]|uniref:telomeric repeat-binding factor 2-like n=1 Tax=Vigna unguiculata TaxID=3917 RepID=UPI00101664BE|nr:telomeric repeat-binding factor 2-like [Vigna unguiculata]
MAREVNKQGRVKVPFSGEDTASLLQRYDAPTVLTLLQELANYPHSKFNWYDLAAKTSTGISKAREYQMLWRHLAYGHSMENLDDDAQPLDDDSDLENEREALPRLNRETATEAAAFVKVIIASFKLGESSPSSSVIEAPLTINALSTTDNNESWSNTDIIFPVTVKRQTLPNTSSTRVVEASGSVRSNTFIKKKREPWSEQEDLQLRDAVQRWGEGNWATMIKKDDFPIKRSTSQLSKRWSTLRKREGDIN